MVLKALKGMVYTNGEVFGNEIELAVSDSPDNWYQISVEEMKKIENEREEKPDEVQ